MKRSALIVIDMLHDFIHPDGALYCGPASRAIIPHIKSLLEKERARGGLIIYVQDSHAPDDLEFERFPPHCIAGDPGSRIIPELAPLPGEIVIAKQRFSAFFGTELESILQEAHIDEVDLCGVCTSICVMETCSDLRNRDYKVRVHTPAVADFDQEAHEFALKRMEATLGAALMN